ncbi:hypothetical protein LTR36_008250 [Oleoguttula mirabilis]|uniref:Uncharacterized protein n=1 Tax=Oleoguttula mirabilis TaxID=1507867 RepID=A0AAV9J8V4_9PEZI|nr:hypothetical protein LTR36_008250 [Oleoguttula mirabilis]
MLTAIFDCLCGPANEQATTTSTSTVPGKQYGFTCEKMAYYHNEPITCIEADAAAKVIDALYDAKHRGSSLEQALEELVKANGWWDKAIAKAVLTTLEKTLGAAKVMGGALQRAYEEAVKEAEKMEEFAGEHPVLTGVFCTIVALGVPWLLWPAIVEALGFGELGSFAAAWQSLYGGRVPYGSVFAYLQRLGMTFK